MHERLLPSGYDIESDAAANEEKVIYLSPVPAPLTAIKIDSSFQKLIDAKSGLPADIWFSILDLLDIEDLTQFALTSSGRRLTMAYLPNVEIRSYVMRLGQTKALAATKLQVYQLWHTEIDIQNKPLLLLSKRKAAVGMMIALVALGIMSWQGSARYITDKLLRERHLYNAAKAKVTELLDYYAAHIKLFRSDYYRDSFYENRTGCESACHGTYYCMPCAPQCTYKNFVENREYQASYGDCHNMGNMMAAYNAAMWALFTEACDAIQDNDHFTINVIGAIGIIVVSLAIYCVLSLSIGNYENYYHPVTGETIIPIDPLFGTQPLNKAISADENNALGEAAYVLLKSLTKDEPNEAPTFSAIHRRLNLISDRLQPSLFKQVIDGLVADVAPEEKAAENKILILLSRICDLARGQHERLLPAGDEAIALNTRIISTHSVVTTLLESKQDQLSESVIENAKDLLSSLRQNVNTGTAIIDLAAERTTLAELRAEKTKLASLRISDNLTGALFRRKKKEIVLAAKPQSVLTIKTSIPL